MPAFFILAVLGPVAGARAAARVFRNCEGYPTIEARCAKQGLQEFVWVDGAG